MENPRILTLIPGGFDRFRALAMMYGGENPTNALVCGLLLGLSPHKLDIGRFDFYSNKP
jgi:hypothetical protein